ncbi:amidophosphoribosyltransferase [Candidatus Kaiserbacteria bacterium RIFCSPHIGHO2_01_FULL_49_13]|uniref:Amidophosphoribosyltransferase n=1 Tax=Candidatus Kaiserbacteria bacterium RIFCSPHIGHO2_01_FULL_49_13 TaxID=1798477 RepID=A0A1F6CDP4_9BACT|nr:MAG: amidophosphoribosyltransferase [Candidatus Kaiserbacteria bacterium RIFCSPHIGHO2_01_FULL_49_13]
MAAIAGVFGTADAAKFVALMLHATQHRGQEAAGIAAVQGTNFSIHRAPGEVGDVFGEKSPALSKLVGSSAIGHNRYTTTGSTDVKNTQPLFGDDVHGGLAISHNGHFTNKEVLRDSLQKKGAIFQSETDTEIVLHLYARSGKRQTHERIAEALSRVVGAYSLIALTKNEIVAVRDSHGFRPLVMGKLGDTYAFASEVCALDLIGAQFIREVTPGEIIVIDAQGMRGYHLWAPQPPRPCIFEYVYFSRPDTVFCGRSVNNVRESIGAMLGHESPAPAGSIVVPVLDSGVLHALGYARATGLPYVHGIVRSHYMGRTLIGPEHQISDLNVRRKFNVNRFLVENKCVALVDDSVVRGNTSREIVAMLRKAGAREIHLRVASPPMAHPCFYGLKPKHKILLAAKYSLEEMRVYLQLDSLAFLSLNGLYRAVHGVPRNAAIPQGCDACFTGDYPTALPDLGR